MCCTKPAPCKPKCHRTAAGCQSQFLGSISSGTCTKSDFSGGFAKAQTLTNQSDRVGTCVLKTDKALHSCALVDTSLVISDMKASGVW